MEWNNWHPASLMEERDSVFWAAMRDAFRRKHGREMEWEDVCRLYGGRPMGESQDTGKRGTFSASVDFGIKDQT